MTLQEVSEEYRTSGDARGWTQSTVKKPGKKDVVFIRWGFTDNESRMAVFLIEGRVQQATMAFDKSEYEINEYLLNRNLRAIGEHEWVDPVGNTQWTLSCKDDLCSVMVTGRSKTR